MRVYELEDWLDEDVLEFLYGQLYFDEPLARGPDFDEVLDDDEIDLPAQVIEDAAAAADDVIQAIFDEVDEVNAEIEDLLTQPAPEPEPPHNDGAKWPIPGIRRKRKPKPEIVRPRDLDRLPEDIAREQRETERYLRSLEQQPKPAQPVAPLPEPEQETAAEAPHEPQIAGRAARTVGELLDAHHALEQQERERKRRLLLLLALLD